MSDLYSRPISRCVQLIALALLAHVALSCSLWLPDENRSMPLAPLFNWQLPRQLLFDGMQLGLLIFLAGFALVFPKKKSGMYALLALLVWLVIQDLNRLQPWLYFYLLALGLVLADAGRLESSIGKLHWLLAAVYAWGGFNKLTPFFAEDNFPWFCEAFVWTKPLGQFPIIGYAVALAELAFAIGLLVPRSRAVFRRVVVGFHLFIVLALSSLGLNWNTIVIPWNLAMAGMVWVLFDPALTPATSPGEKSWIAGVTTGIILALAWIFPALNIFHCWDEGLSWKMYSNTQTEASFYSNKPLECPAIAPILKKHAYDGGRKLLLDDWATAELNAPAYNNRRTHKQLARYLCKCTGNPDSSGLLLLTVDRWNRDAARWEEIPCISIAR